MLDSPILDTALALVFIYFLLSTLVSSIAELVSHVLKLRGKNLEFALREVLDDRFNKNYAELLYTHPQLDLMKKKQDSLPEYLSPAQFTAGVMDLVGAGSDRITFHQDEASGVIKEVMVREEDPLERFRKGLDAMQYSDLKVLLQNILDQSHGSEGDPVQRVKTGLENWYGRYMEEVSIWYKRKIRWFVFGISLVVAMALNVDSVVLVQKLYHDEALREPLIAAAVKQVEQEQDVADTNDMALQARLEDIKQQLDNIDSFKLPIGWDAPEDQGGAELGWFQRIRLGFCMAWEQMGRRGFTLTLIGYLFTAIALTMGAPFWYEAMKKMVRLRRKPQTEEA